MSEDSKTKHAPPAALGHGNFDAQADGAVGGIHGFGQQMDVIVASAGTWRGGGVIDIGDLGAGRGRCEQGEK